ncbi:hypothetical protein QT738_22450 [Xanthomonas citri pv. citri]
MKNAITVTSPRNNRPSTDELKAMIKSTKGRFFSAEFIKANGSKRKIVARVGCHIGVKGTSNRKQKDRLITVYEPKVKGYRTINLETLQHFKCGGLNWKVE